MPCDITFSQVCLSNSPLPVRLDPPCAECNTIEIQSSGKIVAPSRRRSPWPKPTTPSGHKFTSLEPAGVHSRARFSSKHRSAWCNLMRHPFPRCFGTHIFSRQIAQTHYILGHWARTFPVFKGFSEFNHIEKIKPEINLDLK